MKRFAVPLLALFALALPTFARAEWMTKEVKWQISGVGPTGSSTGIWIRDTTVTSIGPVDTTSSFTLDDAMPLPRGTLAPGINGQAAVWGFASTQNDTCVIGFLVIQPDTSVTVGSGLTVVPALTSITALIDGRIGGFGAVTSAPLTAGWQKADSALANGAIGGGYILADGVVSFPIRTLSPYGSIFRYSQLRARVTGVGGAVGIPAARVFLRYWRPDVNSHY